MATGMTKPQLVRRLAEKLGTKNKTVAAFIDHLAEVALKETKKHGVFVVPGLGRLVKSSRKARMGRNPQTGEPIQIKAKTVVRFRISKAVKDRIGSPPGRTITKLASSPPDRIITKRASSPADRIITKRASSPADRIIKKKR